MSEMHESLYIYIYIYICLTIEQLNVYENTMTVVHNQVGGFFSYMDMAEQAKHLCGKHWSSGIRSTGMIVLNVSSREISSLLLPSGKTTHSTFCIPLYK